VLAFLARRLLSTSSATPVTNDARSDMRIDSALTLDDVRAAYDAT
jgi:hypothetical protein